MKNSPSHKRYAMAGNYKHGMRYTRIYGIWKAMKQRCFDSNCRNFSKYGGKGITVCHEWKESFQTFYEWAISNGYSDCLTIDRIDVNGNYEPSNCRWATQKKQQNNRSNNRILEFNGVCHTLAEWAEITGISKGTIWARLKCGWTTEKALTTIPIIGTNQYK